MFFSFFIIAMLTHYQDWDPLLDLCKHVGNYCQSLLCCRQSVARSRYQRPRDRVGTSGYVFDRQERESLIGENNCDSDHSELLNDEISLHLETNVNQININTANGPSDRGNDHILLSDRTKDISESEPM